MPNSINHLGINHEMRIYLFYYKRISSAISSSNNQQYHLKTWGPEELPVNYCFQVPGNMFSAIVSALYQCIQINHSAHFLLPENPFVWTGYIRYFRCSGRYGPGTIAMSSVTQNYFRWNILRNDLGRIAVGGPSDLIFKGNGMLNSEVYYDYYRCSETNGINNFYSFYNQS